MARNFRVYEKKRGNRRTGSQKLGSAGEALFFAVLFVLGCGCAAAMLVTLVAPEWKASHRFVRHSCVVVEKRLARQEADDGTRFRPEIQIEYPVDGQTYRSWTYDVRKEWLPDKAPAEKILQRFKIDPHHHYVCWYDPADPNVAVLTRGLSWWVWLAFIVPASFVLIGGGGLVYEMIAWGKSDERRADLARRAADLGSLGNNGSAKPKFPYVPVGRNLTNSPGTTLAFRLPLATGSTWALFAILMACLVWNGIVAVFVTIAVDGYLHGQPDWFLTMFIAPFLLIGIGLLVFLVRQLLVATGIGPTLVEISDHPLYPGCQYSLFFSQTGRLDVKSLEILLVCDEEATFRHGTDTRTEVRRVYQDPLLRQGDFQVRRGLPFEADCRVDVPGGAMHSLKADHNEVNWKILVKGSVAGWPDYQRSFPVVVYPSGNGANGQ